MTFSHPRRVCIGVHDPVVYFVHSGCRQISQPSGDDWSRFQRNDIKPVMPSMPCQINENIHAISSYQVCYDLCIQIANVTPDFAIRPESCRHKVRLICRRIGQYVKALPIKAPHQWLNEVGNRMCMKVWRKEPYSQTASLTGSAHMSRPFQGEKLCLKSPMLSKQEVLIDSVRIQEKHEVITADITVKPSIQRNPQVLQSTLGITFFFVEISQLIANTRITRVNFQKFVHRPFGIVIAAKSLQRNNLVKKDSCMLGLQGKSLFKPLNALYPLARPIEHIGKYHHRVYVLWIQVKSPQQLRPGGIQLPFFQQQGAQRIANICVIRIQALGFGIGKVRGIKRPLKVLRITDAKM